MSIVVREYLLDLGLCRFTNSKIFGLHCDCLSSSEGSSHQDFERSSRALFFLFLVGHLQASHDGCNAQI